MAMSILGSFVENDVDYDKNGQIFVNETKTTVKVWVMKMMTMKTQHICIAIWHLENNSC